MKLLNSLSRITTPGREFIPQIDGLRFVALMAVIAFHVRGICAWHLGVSLEVGPAGTEGFLNRLFNSGHCGVELFFVISGFILAMPFARQHLQKSQVISWKSYYFRRITRLEPPYLIHLAFLFFITAFMLRKSPHLVELYQKPDWLEWTLKHLGVSLFYGSGFVYHGYPQPNIVLWSLEVEVQFYLIAPLLANIFGITHKILRRLCIIAIIFTPLLWNPIILNHPWLAASLMREITFFMTGFLLCDIYLCGDLNQIKNSFFSDLVLIGALSIVFITDEFPFKGSVFMPFCFLVICATAFTGKLASKLLSLRTITTIGGMCYTIYMYHFFIIKSLVRMTVKLSTNIFWIDLIIQFSIILIITIPVCTFLFVFFERPFMKRDWPQIFQKRLKLQAQFTR